MMYTNMEVWAAMMAFLHEPNKQEYNTYVAMREYVADLEELELCIFLDLIDHSEA